MSTGGKLFGIVFENSGFVHMDSDGFTLYCQQSNNAENNVLNYIAECASQKPSTQAALEKHE